MKGENVIVEKSYAFALEIMRLAKLIREKKEYELDSQLWRAATSIGANVEEAQAAQSRADFRSKMSIAAKVTGVSLLAAAHSRWRCPPRG